MGEEKKTIEIRQHLIQCCRSELNQQQSWMKSYFQLANKETDFHTVLQDICLFADKCIVIFPQVQREMKGWRRGRGSRDAVRGKRCLVGMATTRSPVYPPVFPPFLVPDIHFFILVLFFSSRSARVDFFSKIYVVIIKRGNLLKTGVDPCFLHEYV